MEIKQTAASVVLMEEILSEFYGGATRERMRAIELHLSSFERSPDAIAVTLYLFSQANTDVLRMYSLGVLDKLSILAWRNLKSVLREQIRSTLETFLGNFQSRCHCAAYVVKKAVKVMVDLARSDWLQECSPLLRNVCGLLNNADTVELGNIFVLTIVEQIVHPSDELDQNTRTQLRQAFVDQLASLINILVRLLVVCVNASILGDHGEVDLCHDGPLISENSVTHLLNKQDEQCARCLATTLDSITALISWVDLSLCFNMKLLQYLGLLSCMGCSSSEHDHLVAVKAFGCLNELLSRSCAIADFNQQYRMILAHVVVIVRSVLIQPVRDATCNSFEDPYLYSIMFTMKILLSQHFQRFENANERTVILELLFEFTFKTASTELYCNCLSLWCSFMELLSSYQIHQERYLVHRPVMLLVAKEAFLKSQFRHNQRNLDEMEDDSFSATEVNQQSEFRSFLNHTMDLLVSAARLYFNDIYFLIWSNFTECRSIFVSLRQNKPREHDLQKLHCALRDLSSAIRYLAGIRQHCLDPNASEENHKFVEELLEVAELGISMRVCEPANVPERAIWTDCVDLHVQLLLALVTMLPSYSSIESGATANLLQRLALLALNSARSSVISDQSDWQNKGGSIPRLVQTAVALFRSLCIDLQSPMLLDQPSFNEWLEECVNNRFEMDAKTKQSLLGGLVSYLCAGWRGVDPHQHLQRRVQILSALLSTPCTILDQQVAAVSRNESSSVDSDTLRWALIQLTEAVERVISEPTQARQMCLTALRNSLPASNTLLHYYLTDSQFNLPLLHYLVSCFDAFRTQLGLDQARGLLRDVVGLLRAADLHALTLQEDGGPLVENIIKLLQLVVREPSKNYAVFIPDVLDLALHTLSPMLASLPFIDAKCQLLQLMGQLLLHHWNFFFEATQLQQQILQITSEANHSNVYDVLSHREDFMAIIELFGEGLNDEHFHVFKETLTILDMLEDKRSLFRRHLLRECGVAWHLMRLLLNVLLHKRHSLYHEHALETLYAAASADIDDFFGRFLSVYILDCRDVPEGVRNSLLIKIPKAVSDRPSFVASMVSFLSEIRANCAALQLCF